MGIYLIAIWLLVGLATLAIARRQPPSESGPLRQASSAAIPLFVGGVGTGLVSVIVAEPLSSALLWATLGLVNASLASVALARGSRVLPAIGLGLSAIGLVLAALRAMVSLPVIVAAGVICLGAALLGGRPRGDQ